MGFRVKVQGIGLKISGAGLGDYDEQHSSITRKDPKPCIGAKSKPRERLARPV